MGIFTHNNVKNVRQNLVLAVAIPVGQVPMHVTLQKVQSVGHLLQPQIIAEIPYVTAVHVHTHRLTAHTQMPTKEQQPLQTNVVTDNTKLVNQHVQP